MFKTKENHKHKHQKVKKLFSLPVIATIGNIRLKRKSWNGNTIIQTVPDKSLAWYVDCRPHTILSKKSVPKKHYKGHPREWEVLPREWIDVTSKINNDKGIIERAEIQYQDTGRSEVKIIVNEIKELSVPQDKYIWQGEIKLHKNKSDMEKARAKDKGEKDYHCLENEFESHWFDEPLNKPIRKVRIKRDRSRWIIRFTVQKKFETLQKKLLAKDS